MTPYYDHGGITIYHGDCREILPGLGKFDLLLTDPPYGMSNDADYTRFTGGDGGQKRRKHEPIAGDFEPFDPTPLLGHGGAVLWGSNHYSARLPVGSTLIWLKRSDLALGTFLSDAEVAWKSGGHGVYCRRDLSLQGQTCFRKHPNEKPVALMSWCLGFFPEAKTVIDPYMGSGPVAKACKDRGLKYVGIELVEKYCEIAVKRLAQEVLFG